MNRWKKASFALTITSFLLIMTGICLILFNKNDNTDKSNKLDKNEIIENLTTKIKMLSHPYECTISNESNVWPSKGDCLYRKDKTTPDDLTNDYKILSILKDIDLIEKIGIKAETYVIDSTNYIYDSYRISERKVKELYDGLYGKNTYYIEGTKEINLGNSIPYIYYSSEEKNYYVQYDIGNYSKQSQEIKEEISSVVIDEQEAYVYMSVAYMNNENHCAYKDKKLTKKVECFKENEFNEIICQI